VVCASHLTVVLPAEGSMGLPPSPALAKAILKEKNSPTVGEYTEGTY